MYWRCDAIVVLIVCLSFVAGLRHQVVEVVYVCLCKLSYVVLLTVMLRLLLCAIVVLCTCYFVLQAFAIRLLR